MAVDCGHARGRRLLGADLTPRAPAARDAETRCSPIPTTASPATTTLTTRRRRGRLNRDGMALDDHGQRRARPVFPRQRPPRNDRSPGASPPRFRTSARRATCRSRRRWRTREGRLAAILGESRCDRQCDSRAMACPAPSATRLPADGLGTRDARSTATSRCGRPGPTGSATSSGRSTSTRGRHTIMRSATGFEQVEAPHVRQSELCATCHTLITEALGRDGRVIGSLPEQMNFPGMAAQRLLRRGAELPELPHAAGRGADSGVVGARRRA